jgi:hypothetical protein
MNVKLELTTDEKLYCRNILRLLIKDNNIRKIFRKNEVDVDPARLQQICDKLRGQSLVAMNGGTPPSVVGVKLSLDNSENNVTLTP